MLDFAPIPITTATLTYYLEVVIGTVYLLRAVVIYGLRIKQIKAFSIYPIGLSTTLVLWLL
jgi:hypothetical protein